jgi:hypothetical protein
MLPRSVMKALKRIAVVVMVVPGLAAVLALTPTDSPPPGDAPRRVAVGVITEAAHAGVALASFGLAELTPDDGPALTTLHVRATIVNPAARPLSLDASRARLELDGGATSAVFVNADVTTLPIAILDRGERAVIDLYFPLPRELAERRGPVSFALAWPMNAPARLVIRARFDRSGTGLQLAAGGEPAAGAGAQWWFDPRYPWSTYFHRPGYAVPRPPRHAAVTRAPRWDELPAADADDILRECDQW